METVLQDVRYGLRMLFRNPAFTLVAVLSLALGIGANTTIFTLINTVLLHPVPVRDPGSLAAAAQNADRAASLPPQRHRPEQADAPRLPSVPPACRQARPS